VQFALPPAQVQRSAFVNRTLLDGSAVDPKCQSSAEADKENPHKKSTRFSWLK